MGDEEVTRETEVAADPSEVWEALAGSEPLEGWLADQADVELEPGGDLTVRTLEGEERSGWVEEVDPGRRLTFWWSEPGEDAESTRVSLELEEAEGGTLVRVVETRPLAGLEIEAARLVRQAGGSSGPVALAHA